MHAHRYCKSTNPSKTKQTPRQNNERFMLEDINGQSELPYVTGNLGQTQWDPVSPGTPTRGVWQHGAWRGLGNGAARPGESLAFVPDSACRRSRGDPGKTYARVPENSWEHVHNATFEGNNIWNRPHTIHRKTSCENSNNRLLNPDENQSTSATRTNMGHAPK